MLTITNIIQIIGVAIPSTFVGAVYVTKRLLQADIKDVVKQELEPVKADIAELEKNKRSCSECEIFHEMAEKQAEAMNVRFENIENLLRDIHKALLNNKE